MKDFSCMLNYVSLFTVQGVGPDKKWNIDFQVGLFF